MQLGLCHHCSAALCKEHICVVDDPVTAGVPLVRTIVLPKKARLLLCSTCKIGSGAAQINSFRIRRDRTLGNAQNGNSSTSKGPFPMHGQLSTEPNGGRSATQHGWRSVRGTQRRHSSDGLEFQCSQSYVGDRSRHFRWTVEIGGRVQR